MSIVLFLSCNAFFCVSDVFQLLSPRYAYERLLGIEYINHEVNVKH